MAVPHFSSITSQTGVSGGRAPLTLLPAKDLVARIPAAVGAHIGRAGLNAARRPPAADPAFDVIGIVIGRLVVIGVAVGIGVAVAEGCGRNAGRHADSAADHAGCDFAGPEATV